MFDEIAKNVMTKRKNFGAPEQMMFRESVKASELYGKVITIDSIIARNKPKYDTKKKEVMKTKKGDDVYQTVIYVAFGGDKYFASKSPLLIEELKMVAETEIQFREKKDIIIDKLNGKEVKIGTDKVKFQKDGEEFDYPLFVDA